MLVRCSPSVVLLGIRVKEGEQIAVISRTLRVARSTNRVVCRATCQGTRSMVRMDEDRAMSLGCPNYCRSAVIFSVSAQACRRWVRSIEDESHGSDIGGAECLCVYGRSPDDHMQEHILRYRILVSDSRLVAGRQAGLLSRRQGLCMSHGHKHHTSCRICRSTPPKVRRL